MTSLIPVPLQLPVDNLDIPDKVPLLAPWLPLAKVLVPSFWMMFDAVEMS
jgi:hypothetical protein